MNTAAETALGEYGRRVLSRRVNVANESEVIEGLQAAVASMGRIDCVIANAGIGGGARSFSEMSLETWRRVHAVNEEGTFFTLREACKHMVERAKAGDPGGSLMVTSSLSAIDGAARNEAYAATKGAVIPLMKAIAENSQEKGLNQASYHAIGVESTEESCDLNYKKRWTCTPKFELCQRRRACTCTRTPRAR